MGNWGRGPSLETLPCLSIFSMCFVQKVYLWAYGTVSSAAKIGCLFLSPISVFAFSGTFH